MRTKQLRRAMLDILQLAGEYPIESGTLRKHTGDLIRPSLSDDEWTDNLTWLRERSYIVQVPCGFDDTLEQWAITERGRTLLLTL